MLNELWLLLILVMHRAWWQMRPQASKGQRKSTGAVRQWLLSPSKQAEAQPAGKAEAADRDSSATLQDDLLEQLLAIPSPSARFAPPAHASCVNSGNARTVSKIIGAGLWHMI